MTTRQIVHRQQRRVRAHAYLIGQLLRRLEIDVDRRLGDLLAFVDHAASRLPPLLFRQIVLDRVGQSLIRYVSLWHVAASNLSFLLCLAYPTRVPWRR